MYEFRSEIPLSVVVIMGIFSSKFVKSKARVAEEEKHIQPVRLAGSYRCWLVKKYCWLVCVREKYCSG